MFTSSQAIICYQYLAITLFSFLFTVSQPVDLKILFEWHTEQSKRFPSILEQSQKFILYRLSIYFQRIILDSCSLLVKLKVQFT